MASLWFTGEEKTKFALVTTTESKQIMTLHYDNTPMKYKVIFIAVKKDNFQLKNLDILLKFAQNTDRGYTLEPQ